MKCGFDLGDKKIENQTKKIGFQNSQIKLIFLLLKTKSLVDLDWFFRFFSILLTPIIYRHGILVARAINC